MFYAQSNKIQSLARQYLFSLHTADVAEVAGQSVFEKTCATSLNKTAELSQRRPRDAPNIWLHWKVLRVLTTHLATFPEICNRLLFRSTLRMCVQNLKFVALPVPEIIGGIKKFRESLDSSMLPILPNFSRAFVRMDPVNIPAKFEVRSFIRSWDNRGYSKNLGSPWIRPRSIFSQIFNRLLFAWTLWIYLPHLTSVALPIPEIIGGTSKIWGVPGYAHAPFPPKILKGFCSDGPCE